MLNYNHLYYFYMVGKRGNLTQAANDLKISQPSLSIQIKTLESQMNKKLLQKKGRNIELTPEGIKIFTYCSKIFQTAQDLIEHIESDVQQKLPSIKIGISHEVDPEFIVDISQSASRDVKKNYNFKILRVEESELSESINNLEVDLYITNRILTNSKNYIVYKSFNVAVNLFQSQIHKSNESNLILPSSDLLLRSETNLYLQQNDRTNQNIVMESDFISSMVRGVIDGIGVSYLPISYMFEPMEQGLVMRHGPKRGYWQHQIIIYWRGQESLNQWIQKFSNKFNELVSV